VNGVEVRKPEQLLGLDSLIIPGGESTTMAKLANYHNLVGFLVSLLNFRYCRGISSYSEIGW
jgi:glutamine amidotransferase PdxT